MGKNIFDNPYESDSLKLCFDCHPHSKDFKRLCVDTSSDAKEGQKIILTKSSVSLPVGGDQGLLSMWWPKMQELVKKKLVIVMSL